MEGRVYTPGAGHRPRVLAGRDELIQDWILTCNDVAAEGRVASDDLVVVGPRGIGKTSVIDVLGEKAREHGYETIALQAVKGKPHLIDSLVEVAERRIAEERPAWAKARNAFSRLAGVNVSVFGVGGAVSTHRPPDARPASRDPQAAAAALADLSVAVNRERGRGGVMLSVDEMQVAGSDLPVLAAALQQLNRQHPEARVLFAGTGLPNTQRAMIHAGVTHPDRLFNITPLPPQLQDHEARIALTIPAAERGVAWSPQAQQLVIQATGGYPSHLQSFAHRVWQTAQGPTITEVDAQTGIARAAQDFERRSMAPHWADLSARQREYLTALAVAGGEAHSNHVSAIIGRDTSQTSFTRRSLIESGDIYSSGINHIALAMPLTGRYALARYENTRESELAPLDTMLENHRTKAFVTAVAGPLARAQQFTRGLNATPVPAVAADAPGPKRPSESTTRRR